MTDLPTSPPPEPGPEPFASSVGPPFSQEVGGPIDAPAPDASLRSSTGTSRPWWGFGDVLLGAVLFFIASVVGAVFGLPFLDWDTVDLADWAGSSDFTSSQTFLPLLAGSILSQQVVQGAWPFVVSRWKGLGPLLDWRLGFSRSDIGIGVGVGLIGLAAAGLVSAVLTALVNLDDATAAENTDFLVAAKGSPWVWLILFAVVIGAPISEELFFRGLTMRAIEKRFGVPIGIVASSALFALPHIIGFGRHQVVLWGAIFTVGLVLAITTVKTERLGAAIVAHMLFNAIGASAALGVFDRFA